MGKKDNKKHVDGAKNLVSRLASKSSTIEAVKNEIDSFHEQVINKEGQVSAGKFLAVSRDQVINMLTSGAAADQAQDLINVLGHIQSKISANGTTEAPTLGDALSALQSDLTSAQAEHAKHGVMLADLAKSAGDLALQFMQAKHPEDLAKVSGLVGKMSDTLGNVKDGLEKVSAVVTPLADPAAAEPAEANDEAVPVTPAPIEEAKDDTSVVSTGEDVQITDAPVAVDQAPGVDNLGEISVVGDTPVDPAAA
jgi:hypothetical protein